MKTDHERIFEWLADGEYHCSTEMDFMRDARKRISEINKKKIIIDGTPCDGRCGMQHRSKTLKMRRWVQPEPPVTQEIASVGRETPKKVLIPIRGILDAKTERVIFQSSLIL